MTDEGPRYGLSAEWEHEERRLGLLGHVLDPFTTDVLTAVGAGPGLRCLEVGGGTGSIARWLCRQVGPSGEVTATDLDTRWLERLGEPNVTVLRHDLLADDFPAGSFDLIHARAVFEHIADRDRALAKVCGWLAPGGRLVIGDAAWFTALSSNNSVYAAAFQALADLLAQTGTDYEWARTFPAPLLKCGLEDVGVEVWLDAVRGGGALAEFWALGFQHLRARLIEADLLSAETLDDLLALLRDPGFLDLTPMMFYSSGRRAPG
jgi:SAM-dependent methyltransferase